MVSRLAYTSKSEVGAQEIPFLADLFCVQNVDRPTGHSRVKERPLHHGSAEIGRPVSHPTGVPDIQYEFIQQSATKGDPSRGRFLNIRLDSIKVLDEARHPHMVRSIQCPCELSVSCAHCALL